MENTGKIIGAVICMLFGVLLIIRREDVAKRYLWLQDKLEPHFGQPGETGVKIGAVMTGIGFILFGCLDLLRVLV